jgi:hypothetical protein
MALKAQNHVFIYIDGSLRDTHKFKLIFHELGHLLLAHRPATEFALNHRSLNDTDRRTFRIQEREADLFAISCLFILPSLWKPTRIESWISKLSFLKDCFRPKALNSKKNVMNKPDSFSRGTCVPKGSIETESTKRRIQSCDLADGTLGGAGHAEICLERSNKNRFKELPILAA